MTQHIFLHIPKTAGSSVRTLLQQNYPAAGTIGFSGEPEPRAWYQSRPPEFKAQFALVHGHVPYGIHEGLTEYTYFTFLRDPLARHFSDYTFLKHYQPHPLHHDIACGRISLTQWADIFDQHPEFRDRMTRFVSGEGDAGIPDRLSLEKAKLHLRREFTAVGLAERFDESVLIMARRLGWRSIFYLTRNVSQERLPLDATLLARARAGLERDLELYDFGRRLFDASPELADPAFASALDEFRAVRAWLETYISNNPHALFVVGDTLPSLDDLVRQHTPTPALDRYFSRPSLRAA